MIKEFATAPYSRLRTMVVEARSLGYGYTEINRRWMGRCVRKKAYSTLRLAREVASRIPGTNAYECQYCPFWHIGHKNG